jgi:hypothetical protein
MEISLDIFFVATFYLYSSFFSFLFAAVELAGRFVKFVAIFRSSLMGFSMGFDWVSFGSFMGAFSVSFSSISWSFYRTPKTRISHQ